MLLSEGATLALVTEKSKWIVGFVRSARGPQSPPIVGPSPSEGHALPSAFRHGRRLILSLQSPGSAGISRRESINSRHFGASPRSLVYKDPGNCTCFLLLLRAVHWVMSVFFGLMATVS